MSDELWIGPSESESETSMFKLNKQGAFTNEALTAPNAFCQFYTRRSLNDTSVHSALAEQLCSPLTDDKSPENRMGPVCFETFSWNQTVTFHHMWAKPEALACFLHGHNAQQTLSQRGWHAESPSRQETADDEGLGLGRAGERSRLGRGAYQRPDAQGEKSPMLGRRRKLHAVWWIQECQECSKDAVQEQPADDMNALRAASMASMRFSSSSFAEDAWTGGTGDQGLQL